MTPRALIVADDLTGALDSAVAFAKRGLRTAVARRPADLGAVAADYDVLSISTASREGAPADAERAVADAVSAFAGRAPDILMKKVDSRLKGHPGIESRVMALTFGRARAMVCPAVPALGRIVRDGAVTGAGAPAPIAVREAFRGLGIEMDAPDAESAADLDRLVAGAGDDALFVGAAGLAEALARRLAPDVVETAPPPPARPFVLAIGSRDPVTLAQVDRLRAAGGVGEVLAPNGLLPGGRWPAGEVVAALMTPGDEEVGSADAGARFARGLAARLAAEPPRSLLLCGGETADAVLGRLGVGLLEVRGESSPGLVVSTVRGPKGEMTVLTKSGGFGSVRALSDLVAPAAAVRDAQT